MTEDDAFVAAILASPGDDGLRLVYADWLEEHGGAPARVEFIRVQVELAQLEADKKENCTPRWCELSRREKELLGTNDGHYWLELAPGLLADCVLRRGFVADVETTTQHWLQYGPGIVRAHPVEKLVLSDLNHAQFIEGPLLKVRDIERKAHWRWHDNEYRHYIANLGLNTETTINFVRRMTLIETIHQGTYHRYWTSITEMVAEVFDHALDWARNCKD